MSENKEIRPKPMGHLAIHKKVEAIVSSMPASRILDIPSGEGALAGRLQDAGHDLVCSDLFPENFRLPDTVFEKADLDSELPFEDGEFDVVVCVEGLEHIENPANAIREFGRVLRGSGTLIVSVPNIMNIEERMKWLIFGYTSHFKPLSKQALEKINRRYPDVPEVALHINPIGYSELRYLCERSGFRITGIRRDRRKRDWAYLPLTALIRIVARLTPERKRKERWSTELSATEVLLGGNTMIIEAVKDSATYQ